MEIKVGRVDHPMTEEHYIRCIVLYVDGERFVCKKMQVVNYSDAKFRLTLEKNAVIRAVAECNLHGIWEDEKNSSVYRKQRIIFPPLPFKRSDIGAMASLWRFNVE